MNADPTLLQMKYAAVIEKFAGMAQISLDTALRFFYVSETYECMRLGLSDMHCRSDAYLAEDLVQEYAVASKEGISADHA